MIVLLIATLIVVFYFLTCILTLIHYKIEFSMLYEIISKPQQLKYAVLIQEYYKLYIATILIVVIVIFSEGFKKRRSMRKGVEYGSSKWGASKKLSKFYSKDGMILNEKFNMSLDSRVTGKNNNVLVIGGSGTMKTRSFVIPNILQQNTSYIITDPKGEIYKKTAHSLLKANYEVKVLNLINMNNSNAYNPLQNLKKDSDVLKLVQAIIKNTDNKNAVKGDPFWEKAESALMCAIIFYLWKEKVESERTFENIVQLIEEAVCEEGEKSVLDLIYEGLENKYDSNHIAVKYYKIFDQAKGQTRSSILVSVAVRLAPFTLEEVLKLTSKNEITLEEVGDRKTAIFIIISDSDPTFNFLAAIMYTQLFDILFRKADESENGRLNNHVQFILDEFANIGTIPNFSHKIATMRSREISVKIIIQTITQIKTLYKDSWETITGNCDTLLFLGGPEIATLKYICEILGKQTISLNTRSSKNKGFFKKDINVSQSLVGRELLTVDELYRLDNKESILLIRGNYPIKERKFDLKKHSLYKESGEYSKDNVYETIIKKEELEDEIVIYESNDLDVEEIFNLDSEVSEVENLIDDMCDEEIEELRKSLLRQYKESEMLEELEKLVASTSNN